MARPATSLGYAARIERVVGHVARHLDEPLSLETLAGIACFSPYHFHRVYRGIMGETAADTLRRLRLHRAAADLIRTDLPIVRIARMAGYGSTAAFDRAFAARYGESPTRFRSRQGVPALAATTPSFGDAIMYEVSYVTFPRLRLAALEHRGDYQKIGGSFDRLAAWAGGRGLIAPTTRAIGIYYDDPDSVPLADLQSDACFSVADDVTGDGEVRIIDFPAVFCATVLHKGAYAELHVAYDYLYRQWLPKNGKEPADRPAFEEYLNDPRALPASEWLTRVHLPITA